MVGVKVSLGTGGDSRALDPTGHEVAMTAARGAVCKPHTEAKVSLPGLQSPLASIRPVSPAVWRFEVTVSYHERAACPCEAVRRRGPCLGRCPDYHEGHA